MTPPRHSLPPRPPGRLWAAVALLSVLVSATCPPLASTRLDETRARLDSLARVQDDQRSTLGKLEGAVNSGVARLDQLQRQSDARARLGRQLEAELKLLELSQELQQEELGMLRVRLDSLASRRQAAGAQRGTLRAETASLARKLFPLRKLDPLALLLRSTTPKAALGAVRRLPWLARGLEKRLTELGALDRELGELGRAGEAATRRGEEHLQTLERDSRRTDQAREEARLAQRRLAGERQEQDRLLRDLRKDKELAAAQADRLRRAGDEVARQLGALQKGWEERETRRREEGRRQETVANRLQTTPGEVATPPPATSAPPPAPLPASAKPSAKPGPADDRPLGQSKGRLPHPVAGRVVRSFGARPDAASGIVLDNPGIDFSCAPGSPVRAVHGGRVEKLTWVPGFGNTLLVRHGGDCWTVYAKLDNPQVKEGQAVESGQVLGSAGRFDSAEQGSLHFEVWQGRAAQDPRLWLRP